MNKELFSSVTIIRKDVYYAWTTLLHTLVQAESYAAPRGRSSKELLGVQLVIEDAAANVMLDPPADDLNAPRRKLNYQFMVAQWLTTLLGLEDRPLLDRFNRYLAGYESDGSGGHYPSYGPLLKPQWPFLQAILRQDPESRQAVMGLWHPITKLPWNADKGCWELREVPCTLSLQFLLRQGALHVVATMRSSDAWLGLPYDMFNFSMLGNYLASALRRPLGQKIRLGSLVMNLGSSHLYQENFAQAVEVAMMPAGGCAWSPPLTEDIPTPIEQALRDQPGTDLTARVPWNGYEAILRGRPGDAVNQLQALSQLAEVQRAKI